MRAPLLRAMRSLVVPGGAASILAVIGLRLVDLPVGADTAVGAVGMVAVLAAIGLGIRFRCFRLALAAVVLGLAAGCVFLAGDLAAPRASALSILVSLNLVLLLVVDEQSFEWEALGWWLGTVAIQCAAVAMLFRPTYVNLLKPLDAPVFAFLQSTTHIPLLVFAAAAVALLGNWLLHRKPAGAGLFWALCLGYAACLPQPSIEVIALLMTGAAVAAVSVVETSYQIAFHDELTGLAGRRAFNQLTARLEEPYAIAVVDVDHFKKFNDTFGHDVGDQVLRMVAGRLSEVRGGGKAFRNGGEEFALVFAGLSADEALPFAEDVREAIEESVFMVRSTESKQRDRERRRTDRKPRKPRSRSVETQVTVSIGVAEPNAENEPVQEVVHRADMALYAAKQNGRNRVELAAGRKRKAREVTA